MKTNCLKMRNILLSLLALMLFHFPLSSYAHEGHAHPLDKTEITVKAQQVINMAVDQQKLATTWKEATLVDAKTMETNSGGQWLVQYSNSKITGNDKNLFIFFSLDGNYIAMNHTGK